MENKTCKTCKYCGGVCEFLNNCGYEGDINKNTVCRHPSILCDDEYQCSCKVVKWDSYCSDWTPKEVEK